MQRIERFVIVGFVASLAVVLTPRHLTAAPSSEAEEADSEKLIEVEPDKPPSRRSDAEVLKEAATVLRTARPDLAVRLHAMASKLEREEEEER